MALGYNISKSKHFRVMLVFQKKKVKSRSNKKTNSYFFFSTCYFFSCNYDDYICWRMHFVFHVKAINRTKITDGIAICKKAVMHIQKNVLIKRVILNEGQLRLKDNPAT